MSAEGGSNVIKAPVDSVTQVALLEMMTSEALRRYAAKDMTVFWFAGIVIAVTAGAALVEVAAALTEVGEITVTRIVTVYVAPVLGDSTVKTTGRVNPMRAEGGFRIISSPVEIVTQVALLDKTSSAALFRYAVKDKKVFWFAGIVMAVVLGAVRDEVAVALADELGPTTVAGIAVRDEVAVAPADELGPTTVTGTEIVYMLPVAADRTVNSIVLVVPIKADGGLSVASLSAEITA